jgi:tetratricopeptide (TPR) repeat protein
MANRFDMAWDYHLQGFRLHNRPTKEGNLGALEMFVRAIELNPDLARSYGILSFTLLTGWLNDWTNLKTARSLRTRVARRAGRRLRTAAQILEAGGKKGGRPGRNALGPLSDLVLELAQAAVDLDPDDYDNQWSLATANLYSGRVDEGLAGYDKALDLARKQGAPVVNVASIIVDRADAFFYTAKMDATGLSQVQRAIKETEQAIADSTDPKRHHWNWTLGWAYYEAGEYATSLNILLQFNNPHDLIRKNIIASCGALGLKELASPYVTKFRSANPKYTLLMEDRWPYQDSKRLARWKEHLSAGGIEGK